MILKKTYADELAKIEPYIFLTLEQAAFIKESLRNDNKFEKRATTRGGNSYIESITEAHLADYDIENRFVPDPLEIIIAKEDYCNREEKIHEMYDALELLPATQKRRIWYYFFCQMSKSDIAKSENVSPEAVRRSLARGLDRMRKIMLAIHKK